MLVAAGWCSGINAYLTVLLLGIGGRLGWAETPESLQRPWVLATCAALFAVEFVVDKIPLLDSAWDALHTLVRPSVAAAVGAAAAAAGTDAALGQPWASLLAAALALTAHLSKASSRLAINLSPEPATNVAASLGEDIVVAGVVGLALANPELAAIVAVVLLVVFAAVGLALLSLARRALRAIRRRRRGGAGAGAAPASG